MAGNDQRYFVSRARLPYLLRGPARLGSDLFVGGRLANRNVRQRFPYFLLEGCSVHIDRQVHQ